MEAFDKGPPSISSCHWVLTFEDHFDGRALDRSHWSTEYPSGGNGERQYYAQDAFEVKDSSLNIVATQKPSHGYPYSSGIIHTRSLFSQQYGRFVVRARLPYGRGFWPAFWLLSQPHNGPAEIDGFEMLGHDPRTIYMSNHWKDEGASVKHQTVNLSGETDFSAGFHTFEIVWSQARIDWSVDGVMQHTTTQGVPSEPMFLLINLAVGGKWPGNPDDDTHFPGIMQIDYVRAYQKVCGPVPN